MWNLKITIPRYQRGKKAGKVKEVEGEVWCKKCKRITDHYVLYKTSKWEFDEENKRVRYVYYVSECEVCWKKKGIPGEDKEHYTDPVKIKASDWEIFIKEFTW